MKRSAALAALSRDHHHALEPHSFNLSEETLAAPENVLCITHPTRITFG